jgi:hypothetical protein
MPKRGPRWTLEPNAPCRLCGTSVPWILNQRSHERLMARGARSHRTPEGSSCPAWAEQVRHEMTLSA